MGWSRPGRIGPSMAFYRIKRQQRRWEAGKSKGGRERGLGGGATSNPSRMQQVVSPRDTGMSLKAPGLTP